MGKREENRRLRRADAVAAAYDLIAEEGLEALSLRRLATAAGLAVNTLYALFESRDGILEAVVEYGIARRSEDALAQAAAEGDVLDRLDALVQGVSRQMRSDPRPPRSLHRALAARPELRSVAERGAQTVMTRILRDGIDDGSIRRDTDLRALTSFMVRSMMGAMSAWAHEEIGVAGFSRRLRYDLTLAVLAAATSSFATTARQRFLSLQNG